LNAHWNGLDTLTPKEMDYITKAFKVGAVPAALMAWAVIDAFKDDKDKVFGGYYEQGRKKGDVKWGDVRINGKQFSLHIPEVEAAQFVNTMTRSFIKNTGHTSIGMNASKSFIEALGGIISEAPVAGSMIEMAKNPANAAQYFYQGLVPSASRDIARMQDINEKGETTHRFPKSIPVLPPMEASTIDNKVVGILIKSIPRLKVDATNPPKSVTTPPPKLIIKLFLSAPNSVKTFQI
jgi:hypothetical protein